MCSMNRPAPAFPYGNSLQGAVCRDEREKRGLNGLGLVADGLDFPRAWALGLNSSRVEIEPRLAWTREASRIRFSLSLPATGH